MAHTKSGGSTKLGRDSKSKRLGVKINDQETVKSGEIIIRQRGTHYFPGKNVARGGDDTLYALKAGIVKFSSLRKTRFDGSLRKAKIVNVLTPSTPAMETK
ncbi:MAG: 50S ribosomal protein L27 [Candidatus Harrisonbacteria bacterium RIFCSPLOWO2_02_FULL_41_13b]|uniref:Large ribosomal subunit protein bL27 n=1 Tax=Candidatus Harrisonbacteria bacterium RIFCSPLOWO2_02_FULL_41_13b TaxID=1798409 RepID=A0A1G1ZPP6_9BACT|nr:MAG: 50S ribosomal protein L27 [Candidatus Harrisonbacteria bacterium RIFCSPLOWO2_02_FULL_41_13b]